MKLDNVAALTRNNLVDIVGEFRCKPIVLGDPIANWAGPYAPRSYYLAIPLLEGEEFVHSWPDEIGDIEPIDADDPDAANLWSFGALPNESPTGVGIISVIQLSEEEVLREVENPTLPALFAGRAKTARRYVEALAEQMERYFDETLVELGLKIVDERKRTRAITANLGFPSTWKVSEPKVVTEVPNPAGDPSDLAEVSTDHPPASSVAEPTAPDHVVPYRERLDAASFADVQRVTRIWADGIERYPAAYANLNEDRISDLLAATLNATLPGAQREVYSRGGKSDIFIQADVLAAGAAPAKIFICESKWSKNKVWVSEAIDPQLFGYLTSQDTSAMLLLLFDQQGFVAARNNAYGWLKSVNGYLREEPGSVEGWPIFVYTHEERIVRVCIASVHVAPLKATTKGAVQEVSGRGYCLKTKQLRRPLLDGLPSLKSQPARSQKLPQNSSLILTSCETFATLLACLLRRRSLLLESSWVMHV